MENNMTQGSIAKHLLFFAIPVFLGSLFQQFYTMVDTMIVGRFVSVKALAAVGATSSITFLTVGFVIGITTGFGISIAQAYGSQDIPELKKAIGSSFILSAVMLVIMTVGITALLPLILKLLHTPENIYDDSYIYIFIYTLGLVGPMMYNLIASILRALGDSKTPLYFLIFSSILNIVLDLTFILKFHWGVAGASFATVLSQLISGIMCFVYAAKHYKMLRLTGEFFLIDFSLWKKMMGMGIPMALQYCATALGAMVLQTKTNSFGYIAVAAFTAANKLESLSIQPFIALGSAIATYTGQNLGAGKFDRIRQGTKTGFLYTLIISIALAVIIHLIGPSIVKMFLSTDTPEIIPQIMEYADIYLFLMISCYIPLGMIFLYRNALQGMGNGFIPFLGGILELICRSIAALFLTGPFGFWGIAAAGPLAWIGAGIPLCIIYHIDIKKREKRSIAVNA